MIAFVEHSSAISGPSSITNCSLSGEIKGGNDLGCIIGLCEDTSWEIRNCSASGNIINTSASLIGGLVGGTYAPIINSYSTVNIAGNIHSGGLVGWNYSTISNSYSTGKITGSGGGLVGYNLSGTATNSYWDTETSGKTTSAGGTGKTTAEMQNIQT